MQLRKKVLRSSDQQVALTECEFTPDRQSSFRKLEELFCNGKCFASIADTALDLNRTFNDWVT